VALFKSLSQIASAKVGRPGSRAKGWIELAGNDCRACAITVFQKLEQIGPLHVGDRVIAKSSMTMTLNRAKRRERARIGSVGPRECELSKRRGARR